MIQDVLYSKFGCFILCFFLSASSLSAKYSQVKGSADSVVYVIDKTDLLTIRVYPAGKFHSLEVKTQSNTVLFEPNGTGSIGFGFNYKKIGLGLSIGFPSSAERNQIYGRTRKFDIQGSYYGRRFAADGYFQRYRGYYLANPTDFIAWDQEVYPHSPDLKVFTLGGTAHYIFNSKTYSYRAAYLRNEIQKKSAGSFMAGIFIFLDELRAPGGLIPDILPDSIQNTVDIKNINNASFGISGGYMYTLVIRGNFFINLAIAPGIGYKGFEIIGLDDSERSHNTLGVLLQTRIAVGYEFRRFYVGASTTSIVRNFNLQDSELNLGTGQIRLTVGTRFDLKNFR